MQCSSCHTQLAATAKFCGVCGTTIGSAVTSGVSGAAIAPVQTASQRPHIQQPNQGSGSLIFAASAPPQKKYRALRTIAGFLKVLAILYAVIAGISSLTLFVTAVSESGRVSGPFNVGPAVMFTGMIGAGLALMFGAIIFTILFGLAEVIHLFIDIEENTRSTRNMLEANAHC